MFTARITSCVWINRCNAFISYGAITQAIDACPVVGIYTAMKHGVHIDKLAQLRSCGTSQMEGAVCCVERYTIPHASLQHTHTHTHTIA